ncbi:Oxoglutarate/iron-dependent dioxygenase [Corchorus olitorius]|uniref:Oxoglutarate/iron-dependent dioxygenase n=1 Tax=Corchorus olitorius TaxID=93759 RepID=A0A1R3G2Y2_9ROSI|nr:Oxoglutarate/iron-dependent dioxygenase [Corchorus olitorius]
MVVTGVFDDSNYDRERELKAFDDSKADQAKTNIQSTIAIIDLQDIDKNPERRKEIIEQVRHASETWGFFQIVNHGIPVNVLEEMKDGVRRFFEQYVEVKKQFYTDIQFEYTKQVTELGTCLFKLLSEALGLNPSHLEDMGCADGLTTLAHYYPPCPEPELTLGTTKHSDNGFLTVLLKDQIGGLQVLYQDQWVDVPPVPGALVVNIGDLLQASSRFF